MTRDEIIRMAREVGIIDFRDEEGSDYVQDVLNDLERFAALVAAAEREACAKLCDSESERGFFNWKNDIPQNKEFWNGGQMFASQLAEEIRARSTP